MTTTTAQLLTALPMHSETGRPLPNTNGWQDRHFSAIRQPNNRESVVILLRGWLQYADTHRAMYESTIGEDGVLSEYWKDIGLGIRGLLNGDCGRLDCGTLDTVILNAMSMNGIDIEEL